MAKPQIIETIQRKRRHRALDKIQDKRTVYFSSTAQVGGIRYYLAGDEDAPVTVVFVHGFGLAAKSWHFQTAEIGLHARCLLMDLSGHGRSQERVSTDNFIDAAADDVFHVLDDSEITGSLILVGHCLGGMTILNLMRRYPQLRARVKGMVLVATAAEAFSGENFTQLMAQPIFVNNEETVPETNNLSKLIASVFLPEHASQEVVTFYTEALNRLPRATVLGFSQALHTHDENIAETSISGIPGTIFVGDQDMVTPPAQAQHLQQLWPEATLNIIPGVGHILPLEKPRTLSMAITELITATGE
ncbi:Alpha/beta hydrolase [Corynebacterium kutscheri]|uniref:Alpha/beta hydrolase n=1 Tax=Corynebacterium kutscheri TaxID=35755 RepID=A0A0F6R1N9_9CORY|nr:alpha/beta hydrolase [Corynebacterium kutscheri]AKE41980.1 putative hydrolase or acyltransferase of alpha/beta superfamily [Corynebacterium kutscheri]VEH06230.1 Alpha/beta hydrolase [Corynebacterium kutscheri]VEH10321.1 Alpha/beta hydrolase [Corynebacterium kutscheri]VEH82146.1 Alpha/beta hydrolase [Corynebacterium kutscheri]